ncbi:respiratory nitrate reductase subunit gamma, partial [Salmonella enterica]|uniref:respiratory nitrate reductase subunit gamma n=1 Tax=Salmonella enterica TaxID=28901 RepID=UPI0035CD2D57
MIHRSYLTHTGQYTKRDASRQMLERKAKNLASNQFHIGNMGKNAGNFLGKLTPHRKNEALLPLYE